MGRHKKEVLGRLCAAKDCDNIFYSLLKKRKFCSIWCARRGENNPFYGRSHTGVSLQKISSSNKGRKADEETRLKLSLSHSGNKNGFFGKKHSIKTKEMISDINKIRCAGNLNGFFGKQHSEYSKKKMSETRSRKISSGEIDPINNSRKGWHDNMYYHSLYELKRMMELKEDRNVEYFTKNHDIRVPYIYNGKAKIYIPDFLVIYRDGRKLIEEIKGHESDKDFSKYKAVEEFARIKGFDFRVLYKQDIFASNKIYREFIKTRGKYDKV